MAASITMVFCVGLLGVSPANAAGGKGCPKQAGQLYVSYYKNARVWHRGSFLYACVARRTGLHSESKGKRVRLGPWNRYSRFQYESATGTAVWIGPASRGASNYRLWAVGLSGYAHLSGIKANPPTTPEDTTDGQDGYISNFIAANGVVAWTSGDSAYLAQLSSSDSISLVTSKNFTLAPTTRGPIAHLGDWPGRGSQLAASLTVTDTGESDGDECGGGSGFLVSVTPIAPETLTVSGLYSYGDDWRCL